MRERQSLNWYLLKAQPLPLRTSKILIPSAELQRKLHKDISMEVSTENILQCSFKQLGGGKQREGEGEGREVLHTVKVSKLYVTCDTEIFLFLCPKY